MTSKHPRFRDDNLREVGFRLSGAALLLFAAAAVLAWSFLPPPLPRVVRLGTGPEGGHYDRFGEGLRAEMAEHNTRLDLVATAGSMENIQLLLNGKVDVALVQGGNLTETQAKRLSSIAAVSYEPLLVVQRRDWSSDHIEGGRIAIDVPGSGVHALTRRLLEDQGVQEGVPPGTRLVEIGREAAVAALQSGEIDSGVFASSLDTDWVRILFSDPHLEVSHFALAEAFARHYRYLHRLVIPAGLIDLKDEIPPDNVEVIATTTSLVIHDDTHRALIPLLIESAREQLYQGDLLAGPDTFPSAHGVEAPLAEEALHYFEHGPSFFYRWLPYRYAFAVARLSIVLLPLLTLFYPLLRSAGPTYRWMIQRRVYRWYQVLRRLEHRIDTSEDDTELRRIHEELEQVGEEIRHMRVPARYGAMLFALRAHHRFLLDRLERLRKSLPGA